MANFAITSKINVQEMGTLQQGGDVSLSKTIFSTSSYSIGGSTFIANTSGNFNFTSKNTNIVDTYKFVNLAARPASGQVYPRVV